MSYHFLRRQLCASAFAATAAVALIAAPLATFAQSTSVMPALYTAGGVEVNTGAPVPAGYYFLQPGNQASQVYYYGNGVYFDPATGLYGGSVNNPTGTAGASLNYSAGGVEKGGGPGVPNTGAGGQAAMAWLAIALSAAVLVSGGSYIVMMARRARLS